MKIKQSNKGWRLSFDNGDQVKGTGEFPSLKAACTYCWKTFKCMPDKDVPGAESFAVGFALHRAIQDLERRHTSGRVTQVAPKFYMVRRSPTAQEVKVNYEVIHGFVFARKDSERIS